MISNITNIIKKSVINVVFYHFGINKYKTNLLVPPVVIDWSLCNIKVVANWVPGEDILDLHQSFSSYIFSHVVVEGKEEEGE